MHGTAIPSRAWYLYLPRVQRREDPYRIVRRVAARLRTTLVSPNYFVLIVWSGDRKLTARVENIDRLRPRPERVLRKGPSEGERTERKERNTASLI